MMLTIVLMLALGFLLGFEYKRDVEYVNPSKSAPSTIKANHFYVAVTHDTFKIYINGELQIVLEDNKTQEYFSLYDRDYSVSFYYPKNKDETIAFDKELLIYGTNTSSLSLQ